MTSYAKQQLIGLIFLVLAGVWLLTAFLIKIDNPFLKWGWFIQGLTLALLVLIPLDSLYLLISIPVSLGVEAGLILWLGKPLSEDLKFIEGIVLFVAISLTVASVASIIFTPILWKVSRSD